MLSQSIFIVNHGRERRPVRRIRRATLALSRRLLQVDVLGAARCSVQYYALQL